MGIKTIARNKRASHDYQLLEKVEAGIELKGTEVKSLRAGKCTIAESHITISKKNECFINNLIIPHYEFGNINNHDENRKRKLLLHKKEIEDLRHQMQAGGLTIIPLQIYFKNSHVKMQIALGRGKKLHDKRHDQKEKDIKRKLQRGDYS